MNFKRISAGALALTMTAALGANALAADKPEGWTPADGARGPMLISARVNYQHQLFLNDEELDTAAIPAVEGQQLPMRLLAEADGGSAEWYEEDNQGMFFLGDQAIVVNFADGSVEVGFEKVENVTATVIEGVTFLPADFVNSLEGIEVNLNEEMDVDRIDVATPNGTPIMKLANAIRETADMGMSMKQTAAELEEVWSETHGFKAEYVTEGVFFLGMMTTPDTLALGKVAEGKEEDLKAALESYRKSQEETFSWYLSQNLPKVENAQDRRGGDGQGRGRRREQARSRNRCRGSDRDRGPEGRQQGRSLIGHFTEPKGRGTVYHAPFFIKKLFSSCLQGRILVLLEASTKMATMTLLPLASVLVTMPAFL